MKRADPYKDRRQVSAASIGVTALIASGLLSTSQASFSLHNGHLIHESVWQIPFIICLTAFAISCLSWLLTYFPTALPRSLKLFDPTIQYSLCQESSIYFFTDTGSRTQFDGQIMVMFKNIGQSVIDVDVEKFEVKIMGKTPGEQVAFHTLRIPPGQVRSIRTSVVSSLPNNCLISGEISYSLIYGSPVDDAKYRNRHAFTLQTLRPVQLPALESVAIDIDKSSVVDERIAPMTDRPGRVHRYQREIIVAILAAALALVGTSLYFELRGPSNSYVDGYNFAVAFTHGQRHLSVHDSKVDAHSSCSVWSFSDAGLVPPRDVPREWRQGCEAALTSDAHTTIG